MIIYFDLFIFFNDLNAQNIIEPKIIICINLEICIEIFTFRNDILIKIQKNNNQCRVGSSKKKLILFKKSTA